jgi:hypothetical protein
MCQHQPGGVSCNANYHSRRVCIWHSCTHETRLHVLTLHIPVWLLHPLLPQDIAEQHSSVLAQQHGSAASPADSNADDVTSEFSLSSSCGDSSRPNSCTADSSNNTATPAAAAKPRRCTSVDKRLRRQLGLGSVSDGAGDTWSAVAGAAGAAGPTSHLQKLQRRLSQYTAQKMAYSEAHGGIMLVLYVDSR